VGLLCWFLFLFFIVKLATPPGEEPVVIALAITVDPNPMPGRTGDDAAFQPAVKGVSGVVKGTCLLSQIGGPGWETGIIEISQPGL
jgi:hypothetical protein